MSDGLMAQAVGDAVGATKRQIQIWTDAGVLECRPETDRRGRGRQRIYDRHELPYAAMAAMLSRMYFPIGDLKNLVKIARVFLENPPKPPLRAKMARWLVIGYEPGKDPAFLTVAYDKNFRNAAMQSFPLTVTINLKEIMGPYWVSIKKSSLAELAK